VEQPAVRRLLRNVADTQDQELSCTECFALLPEYVDVEVRGQRDQRTRPELQQHLRQCGVCREEYEVLRAFVQLEDGGNSLPI
jgi:hypothetical protein